MSGLGLIDGYSEKTRRFEVNAEGDAVELAIAFVNDALEGEYQFGQACVDLRKQALRDAQSWDPFKNMALERKLSKRYLNIPRLAKAKLRPAFGLRASLLDEERLNNQLARFRKRVVLKASLFDSSIFTSVIRFLVTRNDMGDTTMVSHRVDIVVDDGVLKLAGASQDVCPDCEGMSVLRGIECRCEHGGFLVPPSNDVGVRGSPLEVRRLGERPAYYGDLYDADC